MPHHIVNANYSYIQSTFQALILKLYLAFYLPEKRIYFLCAIIQNFFFSLLRAIFVQGNEVCDLSVMCLLPPPQPPMLKALCMHMMEQLF